MSILIDMEMPKEMRTFTIFPNGYVAIYDAFDTFIGETKAIQIPPHGGLIDADKFERIKYEIPIKPANYSRGFHEGVNFVQKLIMDAPTIIPADEAEQWGGNTE